MHATADTTAVINPQPLGAARDARRYALCGRFSLNQAFSASYLPM